MSNAPIVLDDAGLIGADIVRKHGLTCQFGDLKAHDGATYERVCITEVPGLRSLIEAVCGPVQMLAMGYRLNYAGELPNSLIHSDLGWGTHALVMYLTDGPGGTAFWTHKPTGTERIDAGDKALLKRVEQDWDDESRWDMRQLVDMKFGRALIYESALYHSRFPFAAFGSSPEDGRLVAVAFFNLES